MASTMMRTMAHPSGCSTSYPASRPQYCLSSHSTIRPLLPKGHSRSYIAGTASGRSSTTKPHAAAKQHASLTNEKDAGVASARWAKPGPWDPSELEAMALEEVHGAEEERGQLWRSLVMEDPDALVSPGEDTLAALIQGCEAGDPEAKHLLESEVPASVANVVRGMGMWRLKGSVDEAIEYLVVRLEGAWREIMELDLCLYPSIKWKAQGYDFCDSVDPGRELKGWAYADVPDPEHGEEGYPRLLIENRLYSSRVFRKLHVEVGWRQDDLQLLHVVLYPRYEYDVPILSLDLLVVKGACTLAVVDACPVRNDRSLPAGYLQTMQELQQHFMPDLLPQSEVPEWGRPLFSDACVCVRPTTPEQLSQLMRYVLALHRAHLMFANLCDPPQEGDRRSAARRQEVLECHKRFVDLQLANQKAGDVLGAAFGGDWARRYMAQVVYDYDPSDRPPYGKEDVAHFYDYFEKEPELGTLPQEMAEIRAQQMSENGWGVLNQVAMGQKVSTNRLRQALQDLFEYDTGFREAALNAIPKLQDMDLLPQAGSILVDWYKEVNPELAGLVVEPSWTK